MTRAKVHGTPCSTAQPVSAYGRLLEVTNGGFVDAKREEPRLSVGQLWGNPTGGFGSLFPVQRPLSATGFRSLPMA